ncbi:glr3350 [Gloeobacter violaceus PCC 7421]|uniref:Glr3350 protein n=1 Tax=Gloeobacter violaceus (strain ATCC 29082 / PCC 7421) TaxID=251221 RepID=Q7NG24_GLOVI|nr:glr3350 [Gloeobacter violaceus PCC 7421]
MNLDFSRRLAHPTKILQPLYLPAESRFEGFDVQFSEGALELNLQTGYSDSPSQEDETFVTTFGAKLDLGAPQVGISRFEDWNGPDSTTYSGGVQLGDVELGGAVPRQRPWTRSTHLQRSVPRW